MPSTSTDLAPRSADPDVYLSVPDLHVDEIDLDVGRLEAQLSLRARVANLVDLQAGAHVAIENVHLTIKGVAAKAALKIHLDNVRAILDRTLTTVDRNPEILAEALQTVQETTGTLAHLGERVRGTRGAMRNLRVTPKIATAAGVAAGAALVAYNEGGLDKTIKELTH
jgi:hypothetical protein